MYVPPVMQNSERNTIPYIPVQNYIIMNYYEVCKHVYVVCISTPCVRGSKGDMYLVALIAVLVSSNAVGL